MLRELSDKSEEYYKLISNYVPIKQNILHSSTVINPLNNNLLNNNNPLNTNAIINPLNTTVNIPMQVNVLGGGGCLNLSGLPNATGNLNVVGLPSSHRVNNNSNINKDEIIKGDNKDEVKE